MKPNILQLILLESFSNKNIPRIPEPMIMSDLENAKSFDEAGDIYGALVPIYLFAAEKISQMTPYSGTVLDLGSGSGQFIFLLKKLRPDLKIICIELSSEMINIAISKLSTNEDITNKEEIKFINSDMTQLQNIEYLKNTKIDTISSIFSIHHLPNELFLEKLFEEISFFIKRDDSKVFIFDHARPFSKKTPDIFPKIFTSNLSLIFQNDSKNSLIAAFTIDEILSKIKKFKLSITKAKRSKLIPLYQYFILNNENAKVNFSKLNKKIALSFVTRTQYFQLRGLFL